MRASLGIQPLKQITEIFIDVCGLSALLSQPQHVLKVGSDLRLRSWQALVAQFKSIIFNFGPTPTATACHLHSLLQSLLK